MAEEKIKFAINPLPNTNTLGIPAEDVSKLEPRAEIVFIQSDTKMVECCLNCWPEIKETSDPLPKSHVIAVQIFQLLKALAVTGQLQEIIKIV